MFIKQSSRWMLVYFFIVYSIFTASIVEGSVLCIGDDGHIAVEMVCQCGNQQLPGSPGASLSASSISCVDVPLISATFSLSSAESISGVSAQPLPLLSSAEASLRVVDMDNISIPSSEYTWHHATPVSISSTILRI